MAELPFPGFITKLQTRGNFQIFQARRRVGPVRLERPVECPTLRDPALRISDDGPVRCAA
jgi:hypothetical protein